MSPCQSYILLLCNHFWSWVIKLYLPVVYVCTLLSAGDNLPNATWDSRDFGFSVMLTAYIWCYLCLSWLFSFSAISAEEHLMTAGVLVTNMSMYILFYTACCETNPVSTPSLNSTCKRFWMPCLHPGCHQLTILVHSHFLCKITHISCKVVSWRNKSISPSLRCLTISLIS